MPWPVARLLKRPWMTLIFFLSGSSGLSVWPSFISSPEPSAPQWSSLTPLPRKTTPKRFGNAVAPGDALAAKDSSHGSAIVTPAPRSTARREMRSGMLVPSLRQELRAFDNRFYERRELILPLNELCAHPV